MWNIPFFQPNPARAHVQDLNKIFARLTGEWGYFPPKGIQCEVPYELAEPYCIAMNEMAGQTVATLKESHDIAVMKPVAMDLAIITLDPELLAETKLLDSLRSDNGSKIFHEIYKSWSSRVTGGMRAAQFAFHNPRP